MFAGRNRRAHGSRRHSHEEKKKRLCELDCGGKTEPLTAPPLATGLRNKHNDGIIFPQATPASRSWLCISWWITRII